MNCGNIFFKFLTVNEIDERSNFLPFQGLSVFVNLAIKICFYFVTSRVLQIETLNLGREFRRLSCIH
jgi:hypothetical protein